MTTMERSHWFAIGLGLALAGCQTTVVGSLRQKEEPDQPVERFLRVENPIAGRYIVVLKQEQLQRGVLTPVTPRASVLAELYRGQVAMELEGAVDGFVAQMSEEDAIAMSADSAVEFVEQDAIVTISEAQEDPPIGLDRIDQRDLPRDGLYNFDRDGTGVHAYVIDTGIRATHQALGGRLGDGFDAIGDGIGTDDCFGHGTHVAGTIGSDLFGVAKNVTLHPVRVLGCDGSGSNSSVIAGINFVAQNAVLPAVANMSLGSPASAAVDQAVRGAIAAGVTFAVAAGNQSLDACNFSPARTAEALTVASISDQRDRRSGFSNFGSCVDVFAPGEGIESTFSDSDIATAVLSGTSMATPHVAGTVALFLQNNPDATPAQVAAALLAGATPGLVRGDLRGSPNLLLNTAFVTGGAPPPAPPPPTPSPDDGMPTSGSAEGEVAQGQRIDFVPLPVLAGTTIEVRLSGTGDPDLYVSIDQPAALVTRSTQTDTLCAPFLEGANETCAMTVPASGTQAFITVHGFEAASFRIDASWVVPPPP